MRNAPDYCRELERIENPERRTALACLPVCPIHGDQLDLQKPGTPEQEFCGTWYRCPQCGYTVLYPSQELLLDLAH